MFAAVAIGGIAIGILLGVAVSTICIVTAVKKYDAWSYWVPEHTWISPSGREHFYAGYWTNDKSFYLGFLGGIFGGPLAGLLGSLSAIGLLGCPVWVWKVRELEAVEALKKEPTSEGTIEKVFRAAGHKALVDPLRMTEQGHAIAKRILGIKTYRAALKKRVPHYLLASYHSDREIKRKDAVKVIKRSFYDETVCPPAFAASGDAKSKTLEDLKKSVEDIDKSLDGETILKTIKEMIDEDTKAMYREEMNKYLPDWILPNRMVILDCYYRKDEAARKILRERISSFPSDAIKALVKDLERVDEALEAVRKVPDNLSFLELYGIVDGSIKAHDLPQIGNIFDEVLAEKALLFLQSDPKPTSQEISKIWQRVTEWGAHALADTLLLAQDPTLLQLHVSKEDDFLPLLQKQQQNWLKKSLEDPLFARSLRWVLTAQNRESLPQVKCVLDVLGAIQNFPKTFAQHDWLQDFITVSNQKEFEKLFETHRNAFFILSSELPDLCKALLSFHKEYMHEDVLNKRRLYVDVMYRVKTQQATLSLSAVYGALGDDTPHHPTALQGLSTIDLVNLVAFAASVYHRLPLGAVLDELLVNKLPASNPSEEDWLRYQEVSALPHAGCTQFADRVSNVQVAAAPAAVEVAQEVSTGAPSLQESIDHHFMKRRKKLTQEELAMVFSSSFINDNKYEKIETPGCPKTAQALLEDALGGADCSGMWTDGRCFANRSAAGLINTWKFVEEYGDWRTHERLVHFLRTTSNENILKSLRETAIPPSLYRILRTNPYYRDLT